MEKRHIARGLGTLALLAAAAALAGCVAPYGPGYRQGYYGGNHDAYQENRDHGDRADRQDHPRQDERGRAGSDRYAHRDHADHGDQGYDNNR